MTKSQNIEITVEQYLKLGGCLKSLIGQKIKPITYTTYSSNMVIANAISREIKKGKNKGQIENKLLIDTIYISNNIEYKYTRQTTNMGRWYIKAEVILAPPLVKLDGLVDRISNAPKVLNESLATIYKSYGKD